MSPLAADRFGNGALAVVLLHGVGGGRRIWGDEASSTTRALGDAGFTAVAIDLPGYGDSLLPAGLTLSTMSSAVSATVRSLGFDSAVFVGHSMGGMVAQELAATEPDLVSGLVLACTSPAFGKPGGDWQQGFLRDRLSRLDGGLGMPALAAELVRGMVAQGADVAAINSATAVMARVPEATYRAALSAIVAFDRRAALANIRVPTLCLAAEHDRTAPPDMMQRMAGHVPGAEYLGLAQAGHIANVEQPSAFNAALLSFLQRHFS